MVIQMLDNKEKIVLKIFKNPEKEFSISEISKEINISPMGGLKIVRKLEQEGILSLRNIGRSKIPNINFSNDYAKRYVVFLLRKEAELSSPKIKVWISEVKKIKNASVGVLFGSVLRKERQSNDIDVLFVTNQERFKKLRAEIDNINSINIKRLHPLYQTEKDFKDNLRKKDKVLLNAIKGIIVFGGDEFVGLMEK